MQTLPLYAAEDLQLAIEQVEPTPYAPECQGCKLHSGVRTPCIPAEVSGPEVGPILLVIGSSPGAQEDRQGRHALSQTGMYLRKLLATGWGGPIVYDTAVRCAPGARKASAAHIKSCRGYGAYTLQQAQPARIICLGAEAVSSVLGESIPTMSIRKGYAYTSTGTPVFFVLHPTLALCNHFVRGWFEEDLTWAMTAAPERPPTAGIALMPRSVEESEDAVEDLRLASWVTWDIETFGAAFDDEAVVLNIAVTPGESDYAYVWDRAQLEDPEVAAPLFQLLEDPTVVKGGHGLTFDVVFMMAVHGVRSYADFDTMVMRRLMDGDVKLRLEFAQTLVGMSGGKRVAHGYRDKGVKQLQKASKQSTLAAVVAQMKTVEHTLTTDEMSTAVQRVRHGGEPKTYAYAAIPPDTRSTYNALDTVSTDRLKRNQDARLATDPGPQHVWDTVAGDMNRALTIMEFNGVRASRSVVSELQRSAQATMDEIKARFDVQYRSVNFNAPLDVGEFLFDELKLKSTSVTATGQRQVGAAQIEKLNHPACADILSWKRARHFKSQYADGMAAAIRDDGRIHPSYQVVGTTTGRISCWNPNLLNIPRADSADGKLCRDIIVADDGYGLVEADQSQIELRVAAMLSGDEAMLQVFLDGEDFHLATAREVAPMLGINPADVTKAHPLRNRAKTVNFGTLYGEPPGALAKKLGVSRARAEQLQNAILGKFHKLRDWIKAQLAFSKKHGYTHTYWEGEEFRRRSLWQIADHSDGTRQTAERSSYNTPIQGTAADYTNASLWPIQQWLDATKFPAKSVLTVYDSIILEVREDLVEEAGAKVKSVMESWYSGDVPLVCDLKQGRAWGSLEDMEAA